MNRQSFGFFRHFKMEWVGFVAASLILAALFTYHMVQRHEWLIAQEETQLTDAAAASEIVISEQLESISLTLSNLRSAFVPGWESRDTTRQFLKERLKMLAFAMHNVKAVTILDKSGVAIASSAQKHVGQSFAYRDYFRIPLAAPAQETLYVASPFKGVSGDWLLALSKVIFGSDGKFAGLALIFLNSDEYEQSLNALRPTPQVWAGLAHSDGILFAWGSDTTSFSGQNLAISGSLFSKHLQSGKAVSFFSDTVYANNERSLTAIRTIKPENLHMDKSLVLAVGRNLDALSQTLQRDIVFIFTLFLFINFIAGAGLFLSQRARHASTLVAESARAHMRELSQQLTSFFELTPSLMILTDKNGTYRKLSPAFEKALGYTSEDFKATSLFDYIHPDERERIRAVADNLQEGHPSQTTLLRFQSKSGAYRYLEVSIALQGEMFFLAALDVTSRETEKKRLRTLAYHDRLTGLPNRALMFDRLQQVINIASREKKKIAVLYIDLDGFKPVNDTHGHDAGDTVLKTVAHRLLGLVRSSDTVARLGGDEFVIILHEVSSEKDASKVARKVLQVVGENIPLESGETARVSASVGISIWPDSGRNLDDILVAADQAMYQSKNSGKSSFTVAAGSAFSPG